MSDWKGTGKFVSQKVSDEINEAAEHARTMPVMTLRGDLPTFSETAWQDVYRKINKAAMDLGLDNGETDKEFRWGLNQQTKEILDND